METTKKVRLSGDAISAMVRSGGQRHYGEPSRTVDLEEAFEARKQHRAPIVHEEITPPEERARRSTVPYVSFTTFASFAEVAAVCDLFEAQHGREIFVAPDDEEKIKAIFADLLAEVRSRK